MAVFHQCIVALRVVILVAPGLSFTALTTANPAEVQESASQDEGKPPMKQEELDQLVAPIALYPDALVSQILMASTYPLEVIEADRWAKKNEKLQGDALAKALEEQTWDASVKSLVNFPQVLTQMSEDLEWMTKLGDAFIGQQKQVMDTVQSLRAKAKEAGNLESNEQQTVTVEKESGTQVIVIESKSPDVIYVPTYDTKVVYGAWPYPAYPPYYYYPPAYTPGTALLSFGVGVACGLAWGYAWGNCNWGHGDVNINVNQNFNRNTNIDRERNTQRERSGSRDGKFQHDPSHRKGVSYRDNATSQKFGKAGSRDAVQARDQFRGRAEAGQRDISSGRVNSGNVGSGRVDNRSGAGGTPGSGNRSGTSAGTRDTSRSGSSGAAKGGSSSKGGAFNGSTKSGSQTRASSSRGSSSRSASGGSRSGGGSRGGGGGGRGGGGRR